MTLHYRYCVNPQQQIAYENFDSETLAINLDTGTYYSMRGSSSRLWNLIVAGVPSASIVAEFRNGKDSDPNAVEVAVGDFLDRLLAEELIAPVATAAEETADVVLAPATPPASFEPFSLDVFTDMQDLLFLDPIHDVEDAGWPLAKQAPGGG